MYWNYGQKILIVCLNPFVNVSFLEFRLQTKTYEYEHKKELQRIIKEIQFDISDMGCKCQPVII